MVDLTGTDPARLRRKSASPILCVDLTLTDV